MIRTRGALAAMLLLSGLRTGGAEPCTPRAALEGDAEAVAQVAAELARLGVATDGKAAGGCRSISAAVELDREGGIAVAVRDQSHRSEGRVVSDAALAAAWIDSWLLDDFVAPAVPVTMSPPGATAPTPPPHADVVAAAPEPQPPWTERLSLGASYESAWTDAGARWSGFAAAACMGVGPFCIGGRAQYLSGSETAGLTEAQRTDLSLVATASYTREVGEMAITPEVGAGIGMLSTSRVDGCAPPPPCDPMTDPSGCPPLPPCVTGMGSGSAGGPVYVGDNFHFAMFTPRVQAALRITVPLFAHVWLDGTASVSLSLFAHTDPYVPAMAPPGLAPSDVALPGDPVATFLLGLGLRVGAR